MMTWAPDKFELATITGSSRVAGYVYKGLGLHPAQATRKGQRITKWALTHLNTGHLVVTIEGDVSAAFPVASKLAECTDWTFTGLKGFVNTDPDLPSKVKAIMAEHPTVSRNAGSNASHDRAQQVLAAREAGK